MTTMEIFSEFEVCDKPKEITAFKGKYEKFFTALKSLSNEKALSIPLSYIGETTFKNWLTYIKTQGKTKHGIRVHAILDGTTIKAFRR